MFVLFTYVFTLGILSFIVLAAALSLSVKSMLELEKSSPFECGFSVQAKTRDSISIHFFLLTVVFLVFDVELILLFPIFLVPSLGQTSLWAFFILIIILLVGVMYEWSLKTLEWANF